MRASVEVLNRPRFLKQTQITQARYARSQISQMDSVCCRLQSHRAVRGLFLVFGSLRDHSLPRSWPQVSR